MKYHISSLLDNIEDSSVELKPQDLISTEWVKALTVQKLHRVDRRRRRPRLARKLIIAAAVVVLLAGSALATKGEQGSVISIVSTVFHSVGTPDTSGTIVIYYVNHLDDGSYSVLQLVETEIDPDHRTERWLTPKGEICLQQYYHTGLTDAPRDPDWFSYDYADVETGKVAYGKSMLCTDYYREGPEGDVLAGHLWRWLNHDTATLLSADAGVSTVMLESFLRHLEVESTRVDE